MSDISISASKFVNDCDYIPIASTIKSLVSIFLRTMDNVLPESIKKTRIYEQLKNTPYTRSLVMLIPILGNIMIALYDFYNLGQSKVLIKKAEEAKSPEEAFKLYEQAAHLGNEKAMHELAKRYDEGKGVPKNSVKAAEWYRKCGEYWSQIGIFEVGEIFDLRADICLMEELFVRMIPDEQTLECQCRSSLFPMDEFKFYKKHAYEGNPAAMYKVADFYDSGKGVEKNPEKASKWLERADAAFLEKYDQDGLSKSLKHPFTIRYHQILPSEDDLVEKVPVL